MRRMCGLSSQTRKRSLLKSMRNMVRPLKAYRGQRGIPRVNHIAAPVKEWFRAAARRRRKGSFSVAELLAQDAFFQAVAGVEQHAHRDRLVGEHLDTDDVARLVVIG